MSNALRVVEKYYSLRDLELLVGFGEKFWREKAQAGELTVTDGAGQVLAQPVLLGKELRIPASSINTFLARNPYRAGEPGIKARNSAELRRKLEKEGVVA